MQALTGSELVRREKFSLRHQFLKPCDPNLVVRFGEIIGRVEALARGPPLVDVPAAGSAHGKSEGERAPLPVRMEHGLVLFRKDRPEAHHAAHVLCPVHDTSRGNSGSPVPIMLSRVTSEASCSSLQPSVPAGRSGSTR